MIVEGAYRKVTPVIFKFGVAAVIDPAGYRAGVAIIIFNRQKKLFWAKRVRQNAWQFPQGGVNEGETLKQTMFRELKEETGLDPEDVKIVTVSKQWFYYRLPKHLIRHRSEPLCIGQKQKWFLLKFIGDDAKFNFNLSEKPEFDDWQWVSYWHPMKEVIVFKKQVYHRALKAFASYVFRHKGGKKEPVQEVSPPPPPSLSE